MKEDTGARLERVEMEWDGMGRRVDRQTDASAKVEMKCMGEWTDR